VAAARAVVGWCTGVERPGLPSVLVPGRSYAQTRVNRAVPANTLGLAAAPVDHTPCASAKPAMRTTVGPP